ncbi:30S ribosomal protein S9 [Candidatus Falkowbacteria bacterium]|nr:30S ribosomal protein S9 [Candidatus Falkowbacteria bacterium]
MKGEYIKAVGRRKRSVAQVRMYKKGSGKVLVNEMPLEAYFDETQAGTVMQPIKMAGIQDADFSILAKGGGKSGQAEAARHAIARLLVKIDEEYKLSIKAKGWLTRDPRRVERKKPGLKKARRAPQWSKR